MKSILIIQSGSKTMRNIAESHRRGDQVDLEFLSSVKEVPLPGGGYRIKRI